MPDLTAVAAVLTSIKTASDIARFFKDSTVTLEQAEFKLKLAELITALAEAKLEIANIQDSLIEKDHTIKTLKDLLETKTNLIYETPYYWLNKDGVKDGPFCQQCYDSDRKLIRLQGNENGTWSCRTCQSNYRDKTYTDFGPSDNEYDPLRNWRTI